MAKAKKISVNAFEKVMKDTYTPTLTFDWNDNEVIVTKTLSLVDMMQFVANVVTGCFDSETGAYMPEVKDFLVKSNILEMYANFNMPKNVSSRYELVYFTDAVDSVIAHINRPQLKEIMTAIDRKIDSIVQSNASLVAKNMNDIMSAFENLQNRTAAVFDNITPEDIKAITGAVADGSLDADKIVKAYVSQKDSE